MTRGRLLSTGEQAVIEVILNASLLDDKKKFIDNLSSMRVIAVNSDGSIMRFIHEKELDDKFQEIISPIGYVHDRFGNVGEVLLFISEKGQLSEFEVVSMGQHDVVAPLWETFPQVNDE